MATLAAALFQAEQQMLELEHRVEAMLNQVFGGEWSGWNFSRAEHLIDVFGAADSPVSVDALFDVGFTTVVIHDHSGDRFVRCSCKHRSVQ